MTFLQSLSLPGGEGAIEGLVKTNNFEGQLTIGGILSKALTFVFPIAGLILLTMIILGGFQLLTSAGNPDKIKAGQGKIVSALIGFVVIFLAYWIMEIVQSVLGFQILTPPQTGNTP
jgi:hypothetical protein